jgi:putative transposase
MFEFASFSVEETKEIARIRILNGYPEHSPSDILSEGVCTFITSKVANESPILNDIRRLTWFESTLNKTFKDFGVKLTGWVVFPDHFHLLLENDSAEKIPHILDEIISISTYRWNTEDSLIARKIWNEYKQTNIDGLENRYAALNYIHNNPIKHHYSSQQSDWLWSSLGLYQRDHGFNWLIEKMLKYPFHEII